MNGGFILAFPDQPSGAAFLARLPLADPLRAQSDLLRFQQSLLAAPPPPLATLQLLEQAQVPLAFVQEERAKTYLNRAVPLAEREEQAFTEVAAAWQRMADLYARVAQRLPGGEDTPERLALILHRCLYYTGQALAEHYRARREVPPGLWLNLHGTYGSAEDWGVATLPVADPREPLECRSHCAAAYVAALLLDLAGPYHLGVRELGLAWRWALQWAPLVTLQAVTPEEEPPRFVADLMQDGGLRPLAVDRELQAEAGLFLRRLDTSRLALQLQQAHQALKARISPVDAGLGEGASASLCVHLLATLFRPWSQAAAQRRFRRHAASGSLRLAVGWEPIHYFIGGQTFAQPENVRVYSRQEFDRLYVFRHQVDPSQPLEVVTSRITHAADEWEVINQSAAGYRLQRGAAGQRLAHGQLLAVSPGPEQPYLLAQASWLMQEGARPEGARTERGHGETPSPVPLAEGAAGAASSGGGLIAGISLMAGHPQAVAARLVGDGHSASEAYSRAFLLPAVAALNEGPSIVLPIGWYAPGREVEVFTDGAWRLKLGKLRQSGSDFERVEFSVCG